MNLYQIHVKIHKFDGRIQTKILHAYADSKDQAIRMIESQYLDQGRCTFRAKIVKEEPRP